MKQTDNLLKIVLIIILCIHIPFLHAQDHLSGIKDEIHHLNSVRNLPYESDATAIIDSVIRHKSSVFYTCENYSQYQLYQRTVLNAIANKDTIRNKIDLTLSKNNFVSNYLIKPFHPWFGYARPTKTLNEMALTTLLLEESKTVFSDHSQGKHGSLLHASGYEGFFQLIGQQNISSLLDEVFGDIDFYQSRCNMMLLAFKNPLAPTASDTYTYHLTGQKQIEGEDCYEIAFYSENKKENAFAGYLYISTDGKYALVKALFTLNNPDNSNFLKNIRISHQYALKDSLRIPDRKETRILLGDEIQGSFLAERTSTYYDYDFSPPQTKIAWGNKHETGYRNRDSAYWENTRPYPLTASESQAENLHHTADETAYFRYLQNTILILMNNHITVGGINGPVELGPLNQFISYNSMEGLRLKIGGNNTVNLSDHFLVGGYGAYGFKDETFKYRGDLIYSLLPRTKYIWEYPKRLFSFTWVNDLNIPGQDLLTSTRDNFIYSFSHSPTDNMSLQRIGILTFENEGNHNFSYKLGARYMYDRPKGVVQYLQVNGTDTGSDTTTVDNITTTEFNLSLRYAPGEKYIQNRDKRIAILRGKFEFNLEHRIGVKNLFSSGYSYQITDLNAYKKFDYKNNSGNLEVYLSAGKVWNRVPFPLLFIPEGNQSYIFKPRSYNCMNFYEFTTDQYVSANLNSMFNWSPLNWFMEKSRIKTTLGGKIIYGPLSDNNNPELHPELFIFNQGVRPLGKTPYAEVSVGLANIFKVLRVEYVRRLTYLNNNSGQNVLKGSLFFTGSFSF